MSQSILILAYDFPPNWGGVATYSWEMANAFHKNGYEVTVVCREQAEPVEADFEVIPVKLPDSGLLAFPKLSFALAKLLHKRNFDRAFCCLWLPDALALFTALKLLRKDMPYSVAVHAMEIVDSNETWKKRMRQKLNPIKEKIFKQAHSVFCVSAFTKNLLTQKIRGLDDSKVHVIANGVNPEVFQKKPEKSTENYPQLMSACRLQKNKGIDQVLKALPTIVKKWPNTHYHILGDGPDRPRLEKLCNMMGVDQNVTFHGKAPLKDLLECYQKSHLLIMLSRQEKHHIEGFGLVFLEAALSGTPSLGGNSGGIPEAIHDGKTGWLVDPYDSNDIETKLLDILSDQSGLIEMGQRAQQWNLENRSWQQVIEKVIGVLNG